MMDEFQAAKAVQDAIDAAVAGRYQDAKRGLFEIGIDSDLRRLYGVCCAIAENGRLVIARAWPGDVDDPNKTWIMQEAIPGSNTSEPDGAWAMRFLVAYLNRDQDMTNALFSAAVADPATMPRRIWALLFGISQIITTAPPTTGGKTVHKRKRHRDHRARLRALSKPRLAQDGEGGRCATVLPGGQRCRGTAIRDGYCARCWTSPTN